MLDESTDDAAEYIDELIEQYVEGRRAGKIATVDEFVSAHPDVADRLRELLPAVSSLEPALDRQHLPNLPNYEIVGELGRGGMGVVYRAYHQGLNRAVALKLLSPHLLSSSKACLRFQREAQASARLHHTNIVSVYESGQHQQQSFISMQLVEGEDLHQRIQRLRQQQLARSGSEFQQHLKSVVQLGIDIASALQYAHGQQVLHRDIKPSNILVDSRNVAWLTDFGLASISDSQLTQSEDLVGTLRYLAPERLHARCVPQSDIFSLGLTLFEYITLEPAFSSLSRAELLSNTRRIPRLRSVVPEVPRDLATIIEKALAGEPEARYPTAEALSRDLINFRDGLPITARPVAQLERLWMWSKRNPTLAATVVTLNCVLLLAALISILAADRFRKLSIEARRNEDSARQVANYFTSMIQGADPAIAFTGFRPANHVIDQNTTAFDWVRRSAEQIDKTNWESSPLVEAQLKDTLGIALIGQMCLDEALPLLTRALELRQRHLSPAHPDIALSLQHLGSYAYFAGDAQGSVEYYERALQLRQTHLADLKKNSPLDQQAIHAASLDASRSQVVLAFALAYASREANPRAEKLLREGLDSRIALLGKDDEEVAYCRLALASVYARNLKVDKTIEEVQEAERILASHNGDQRLTQAFSLYAQGTTLQTLKMTEAACQRFVQAQRLVTEVLGPQHPLAIYARIETADALQRGGQQAEAEAIYRKVISDSSHVEAKYPYLASHWDTLAICLRHQNKFDEAIEAFNRALSIYDQSSLSKPNALPAMVKTRLAECYFAAGRIPEAFTTLRTAADELAELPTEIVGFELSKCLSFMAYITLWHQIDRFPDVIERVVRVGDAQTNPRALYELQSAGTRGPCSPSQAEALLAMNDRWQKMPLSDYDRAEANHYRARILWLLHRPDEALALFDLPPANERRRYQAELFSSLCWLQKGDTARCMQLYETAINSIVQRIPLLNSRDLQKELAGKVNVTLPDSEPSNLIEFHWEQSAYAQYVFRTIEAELNKP